MTSSLDTFVSDNSFWADTSPQTTSHSYINESDLHVLVIDDDVFRWSLTQELLEERNSNVRVTIAPHFEAFKQLAKTQKWALCVVDGNFPRTDKGIAELLGKEALAILEEDGYGPENVVILSTNMEMHNHWISLGYRAAENHINDNASVSMLVAKILKPGFEHRI